MAHVGANERSAYVGRGHVEAGSTHHAFTWSTALCTALIGRFGLWLIAYLGLASIIGAHQGTSGLPGNVILGGWVRWDSQWYAGIAEHGYTNRADNQTAQCDTRFFPFYPLVVRGAAKIVGDIYVAGMLVSNAAFVIATVLLYLLVCREMPDDPVREIAGRAVVLLNVFPFAYAFSAMYSESLFLLCVVAAFYAARRGWWLTAGLCAGAAGATRMVGSATAVALAVLAISARDVTPALRRRQIASVILGFTGLAAWIVYLHVRFHDAFAFINANNAKGCGPQYSVNAAINVMDSWRHTTWGTIAAGQQPMMMSLNLLCIPLGIFLGVLSWLRLPRAYAAFTTLVLAISLTIPDSFGRYMSTAFPIYIVAAMVLRNRRAYHAIVYLCTILLALLTILFAQQYWVS